MVVKFDVMKEEHVQVSKIAERAHLMFSRFGIQRTRLDIRMDIVAVHRNGCPLDLKKLLGFDDFNFSHDVGGIYKFLDRETGKLRDHFLPRCAA